MVLISVSYISMSHSYGRVVGFPLDILEVYNVAIPLPLDEVDNPPPPPQKPKRISVNESTDSDTTSS